MHCLPTVGGHWDAQVPVRTAKHTSRVGAQYQAVLPTMGAVGAGSAKSTAPKADPQPGGKRKGSVDGLTGNADTEPPRAAGGGAADLKKSKAADGGDD